jgi:glycosyltransferase involved in cell wall biosynthesis
MARTVRRRKIIFVMTGAAGIDGGIAAVNLNVLHVLEKLSRDQKGWSLSVMSLHESQDDRPSFLPEDAKFRAYKGDRLSLAGRLLQEGLRGAVSVFDHVTLALPVLPLVAMGRVISVIFAHGSEAWRDLRTTSRWSFRAAELCLTNSHFTLRKMRERLGAFQGKACPLGLSPKFEINRQLPEDPRGNGKEAEITLEAADGSRRGLGKRVLLLVGRMHPEERGKGHDELIEVLPALKEYHPEVQIVFAGPGDDRNRLRRKAWDYGVEDAVFLPGRVSHDVLQQLYRHCYAFTMPSRQEGFGLVYLEAMNYGKPCVGCHNDGAEDIIQDEETGYLICDPDCRDELLDALRRLLRNPEHARRMGKNGFELLHSRFTAEQFQERLRKALEQVLGGMNGPQ